MLLSLVLVWKDNGEELPVLTLVLEMNVPLVGVKALTVVLASVDHLVTMLVVTQPPSLVMR